MKFQAIAEKSAIKTPWGYFFSEPGTSAFRLQNNHVRCFRYCVRFVFRSLIRLQISWSGNCLIYSNYFVVIRAIPTMLACYNLNQSPLITLL